MLKNLFKNTSKRFMKLSLALRALIGTISMAAYVQADVRLAFWFLVVGAVLDFIIQLLPPDTEIKSGAKVLVVGLVAASLLWFSGCRTTRPDASSVTVKDSTIINYKPIDVPLPGFRVTGAVNIDSLLQVYHAATQGGQAVQTAPVIIKDESGKVQLQYWVDQYGKLQIACESKDQTIQLLIAEITKARNEVRTVYKTEYETPVWNYIIMIFLAGALILTLLKR